jgi:Secretion system C-terminal sorting domain
MVFVMKKVICTLLWIIALSATNKALAQEETIDSVIHTAGTLALYPNPAVGNELNLVYPESDDVNCIVIYNLIGKVVMVYKPVAENSAKLDLANVPQGIYLVKLVQADGNVADIRRFIRQ